MSELPPFAARRRPPVRGTLREVPVLIVAAVAIAWVMKTFVAQAFYIPSASMEPQLHVRDRIVVSRISYRLHDPHRGDIVVFDCPPRANCRDDGAGDETLLVRLSRDLGEAVGLLQPRRDEFIKRVIGLPGDTIEGRDGGVYIDGKRLVEPYLPEGTSTGTFPPTEVMPGTLWVMGDNRANSEDSRRFGAIRRDTVLGRTVFRIWPLHSAAFL